MSTLSSTRTLSRRRLLVGTAAVVTLTAAGAPLAQTASAAPAPAPGRTLTGSRPDSGRLLEAGDTMAAAAMRHGADDPDAVDNPLGMALTQLFFETVGAPLDHQISAHGEALLARVRRGERPTWGEVDDLLSDANYLLVTAVDFAAVAAAEYARTEGKGLGEVERWARVRRAAVGAVITA